MKTADLKTALIIGVCLCLRAYLLVDAAPDSRRLVNDCDSGNPADVVFLLDASNSIWRPDFQRQIRFIKELANLFRIGTNYTQISVLTYSDYPQFQFYLNYYSTKKDVLDAIDNVGQMGGYHTSTPEALRYLRERAFLPSNGGRSNVTRVGIVITDGNSDEPVKTNAEAQKAKDAGIHLFAVGVGSKLDLTELESIASFPSKYYTFMVESYSGLENIKELLAIKTCSVTDPPPTTPTTVTTTTPTTTTTMTSSSTSTTTTRSKESDIRKPTSARQEDLSELKERENSHYDGMQVLPPDPSIEEIDGDGPDGEKRKWNGRDFEKSGRDHTDEEEWRNRRRHGQNGKHGDENESTDLGQVGNDNNNGTKYFGIGQIEIATQPSADSWGEDYTWVWDDIRAEWRKQFLEKRQDGTGNGDGRNSSRGSDNEFLPVEIDPERNQSKHVQGSSSSHTKEGEKKSGHKRPNEIGKGDRYQEDSENKNNSSSQRNSGCKPKTPLDVVFVVDPKTRDKRSSRHLWEAVRNVVDNVDMDHGQMRVQFVHSCTKGGKLRNRSSSKASLIDVLEENAFSARSTSDLIETMTTKLVNNGKAGRKKIGIYLTNGQSGDLEKTLEVVQEAKTHHGVEMFTVGLGKDVSPVELRAIASCEVPKHAFAMRQYPKSKETILKQLAKSLCSVR